MQCCVIPAGLTCQGATLPGRRGGNLRTQRRLLHGLPRVGSAGPGLARCCRWAHGVSATPLGPSTGALLPAAAFTTALHRHRMPLGLAVVHQRVQLQKRPAAVRHVAAQLAGQELPQSGAARRAGGGGGVPQAQAAEEVARHQRVQCGVVHLLRAQLLGLPVGHGHQRVLGHLEAHDLLCERRETAAVVAQPRSNDLQIEEAPKVGAAPLECLRHLFAVRAVPGKAHKRDAAVLQKGAQAGRQLVPHAAGAQQHAQRRRGQLDERHRGAARGRQVGAPLQVDRHHAVGHAGAQLRQRGVRLRFRLRQQRVRLQAREEGALAVARGAARAPLRPSALGLHFVQVKVRHCERAARPGAAPLRAAAARGHRHRRLRVGAPNPCRGQPHT
mmetsp:Transcript_29728/g.74637  ORF Transcript_29728/g.74637 Transcript_29728/m.74637 type:complete len:386 (+) Transcript_29728:171-1328(+)